MNELLIFLGGLGTGVGIGVVAGGYIARSHIAAGWRISQRMNPIPEPTPTLAEPLPEPKAAENPLPFLVKTQEHPK